MAECKYYKQVRQVSYDNGVTWISLDEYQKGDLYETDSPDCGGGITQYKWVNVSGEYTCVGTTKYQKTKKQQSTDGGQTWTDVNPPEYGTGGVIAYHSSDCGGGSGYEDQYLTLVARGSGAFKKVGHSGTFQYSKDEGNTWATATSASTISVSNGDRVMFKGTLVPNGGVGTFSASTQFEAEGNPMSLIYGDNFRGQTSLVNGSEFAHLFYHCSGLTSIDDLKLVATTVHYQCYSMMFAFCTSLTSIPSGFLPATTVIDEPYYFMFWGCTSLTSIPSDLLPATTLSVGCYAGMFCDCTSLRTAPDLPATTLADGCYDNMFEGCSRLNYIKCLATNISAQYCTRDWLDGVSSSGTFVRASNANWPCESARSVSTVPSGWDIVPPCPSYENQYLTFVARESGTFKYSGSTISNVVSYSLDDGLTWNTLAQQNNSPIIQSGAKIMWKGNLTPSDSNIGVYTVKFTSSGLFDIEGNIMSLLHNDNFRGQTSLSGKDSAFGFMFIESKAVNAENLVLPATTLSNSCYKSMFSYCENLVSAPSVLPATTLSEYCYSRMFSGCTSLTNASVISATTLAKFSCVQMFKNCTSLTTAPDLLASTLGSTGCCNNMFDGCSSLNYVKCLATSGMGYYTTYNWLSNVSSSGTFVKASSATWERGADGIPTNWTIQNA